MHSALNLGLLSLLVAFFGVSHTECYKVVVVTHQFGSHIMLTHAATEGLLKQGHEVYTILSDKTKPKGLEKRGFKVLKYHSENISRTYNDPIVTDKLLDMALGNIPLDLPMGSRVGQHECQDMEADEQLMTQIEKLKPDLMLIDIFPISMCLTFLPLKFNVPFVVMSPTVELETTRSPLLPSIVPFHILEFSDRMSFPQRLLNTIAVTFANMPHFLPFPAVTDTSLIRKYSNDPSVSTWNDVIRKASLYIVTNGPIIAYPKPSLPHVVTVEGLLCSPGKPLPQDLEDLLAPRDAVIIMSFGSGIRALPDYVSVKFLQAFAQRKELVIWRYDGTLPGDIPSNVKIMKWLPQNDLLAHPKTKLFITHSGNNGQYESVYHGVPMLAFPIYGDQPHNAHRIVHHGYGLQADINKFTTEEIVTKIDTILSTPSFAEATKKASKMLKSQPVSPRDQLTNAFSHILEFGAEHLRSNGLDMPWYSYYVLDVLVTILFILTILLSLGICACRFIYRKCCSSSKKVKVN